MCGYDCQRILFPMFRVCIYVVFEFYGREKTSIFEKKTIRNNYGPSREMLAIPFKLTLDLIRISPTVRIQESTGNIASTITLEIES